MKKVLLSLTALSILAVVSCGPSAEEMAKKAKENIEEPLEKKLWKTADKLRKNMDAAEYKHVVLGLIFLKYISDAF